MKTTDKILKLIKDHYKDISIFSVGWSAETKCLIEQWSFKTYNPESNFTGTNSIFLSIMIKNKLHGDIDLLIANNTVKFINILLGSSVPFPEEILRYIQAIINERKAPIYVDKELKQLFNDIEQLELLIKRNQKELKYKIEERDKLVENLNLKYENNTDH